MPQLETSAEVVEKLPLILFSGGLDSTFSLISTLQHSDVDVLCVVSKNIHPNKNIAEKKAQAAILAKLKDLKTKNKIKYSVRKVYTVRVDFAHPRYVIDEGLYQPELWLSAASAVANAELHSHVIISYVRGDCAINVIDAIETMWKGLSNLHQFSRNRRASVPLSFPLITTPKDTILQSMETWLAPWAIKLVWTCEFPVKVGTSVRACGKCVPCKSLAAARLLQAIDNGYITAKDSSTWLASRKKSAPAVKSIPKLKEDRRA